MASKMITMYAEKKYELSEIREEMKRNLEAEFGGEAEHELGETKTLLLIWERWYIRTGSYASVSVLLTEFRGYQCADIISSGGKDDFFSWGAEENFAKCAEDVLRELGFSGKSDNYKGTGI